ncbi:MAG TPA: dipeptidase [Gemmatimonadaceae bacterium]|nr:dipeptidase [Gemmatimonadaceae bacterium]
MTPPSARALALWRDAVVVDLHNDLPSRVADDGYDPGVRHPPGFGRDEGHSDVPRLAESGISAQWLAAWVDAPYALEEPDASFRRALRLIGIIEEMAARHPDRLLLATSAADVRRAKREGKVALLIGVEGGHAIEGSLEKLRTLHARGARYMTLTWNNGNAWAGSSIGCDGTRTGGLTDFGREVLREMERLGMLIDLSHVSDETFADVVESARRPLIASHSNARALHDHPRNLADDQLRAIARTGGVVGVNFYPRFLDPAFAAGRRDHVPMAVVVDHIEHIARVAGVRHVALGSDFDGISATPDGLEDVTRMPRLVDALLGRGFGDDEIAGIIGGNALRVMEAVIG